MGSERELTGGVSVRVSRSGSSREQSPCVHGDRDLADETLARVVRDSDETPARVAGGF